MMDSRMNSYITEYPFKNRDITFTIDRRGTPKLYLTHRKTSSSTYFRICISHEVIFLTRPDRIALIVDTINGITNA